MHLRFVIGSVILLTLFFSTIASAQNPPTAFEDRVAFTAAASNLTTIDFEDQAPRSGFVNYKAPKTFATNGLTFQLTGGGKFGPGSISLVGGWYYAGPIYETTTGAKLTWASPNQPGNAFLEITLPEGVTAVGADLWTAQPAVSSVEVVATTSDGKTQAVTVSTAPRPSPAFIGFTADTSIVSLRLSIPRGQVGLILDNFVFGRAEGGQASSGIARTPNKAVPTEVNSESGPRSRPPATRAEMPARHDVTTSSRGTIAYVRGGTEVRLIEPDGTNDRRLWTHPDARKELGIDSIAWRPDGKELAISSGHAAAASVYHADLYAVGRDGNGFRKLTNSPDISALAGFPKGSVSVTLQNDQPVYRQSQASSGVFIVYVAGAAEPQQITLPPGATKTLVFNQVADFGNTPQAIVAMWGKHRWFIPGVDVRARTTVKAPTFSITGDGIEYFGAFRPIWRSDGSRVSFRSGVCTLNSVGVNPVPGVYVHDPLFGGKNPLGTCTWDWGPTPALANQILYTENDSDDSAIYQIAEGGSHPGKKLTSFSNIEYQLLFDLRWLPDGSGFLFSNQTLMRDSANIFRYDFATGAVKQVTRLQNEFTGAFSISPDGQWVVFEKSKSLDENRDIDLWIVPLKGGEARLLVRDGFSPSWR
jgi:hypothetical protein